MTKEQLEKEAEDKAIELEESQTIGIYDNDEDYEYDRGWNKGEVAGFREGYLAGAEPREKRIKHLEESLLDVTEKSVRQIAELEKENKELKCFIRDLIYENHNLCFHSNNTTCLFNSDYRNRAEELIGERL